MCLAVPAEIVELHEQEAVVNLHGNLVRVSTVLTPDAGCGDWVLIHAGFAIQQMDAEEAQETWSLLADITAAAEGKPRAEEVTS